MGENTQWPFTQPQFWVKGRLFPPNCTSESLIYQFNHQTWPGNARYLVTGEDWSVNVERLPFNESLSHPVIPGPNGPGAATVKPVTA